MKQTDPDCLFCRIVERSQAAAIVFEDESSLGFLDTHPLFHGHTLLVPKEHYETLADLPRELLEPLFGNAQLLARSIERAMGAEGSFVAMNNRVSQSVPHLHIHIVPRRRKDGLRGFFWPRSKYESEETMAGVGEKIWAAVGKLKESAG